MNTETVRYFCSHNDKDDEGYDQDIYVIMKYIDSPSEIKKSLADRWSDVMKKAMKEII